MRKNNILYQKLKIPNIPQFRDAEAQPPDPFLRVLVMQYIQCCE